MDEGRKHSNFEFGPASVAGADKRQRTRPLIAAGRGRRLLLDSVLASLLLIVSLTSGCSRSEPESPAPTATAGDGTQVTTTGSPVPANKNRGEMVSLAEGGSAYLVTPEQGGEKNPAVIVIQEWWGLNDWIRSKSDEFAVRGYVALAPDLYRGRSAADAEEAHELSRALPEDRAVTDLRSALEYLASRSDVDPARIGVIGWCMGGGYALSLAIEEPRLQATVINYGRLVTDPQKLSRIRSPILGNFGGEDRGIPVEDVRAFEAALDQANIAHDIKIYPDQGHAFMNPENEKGFNAEAARDAWQRIETFFERELAAAPVQ